MLYACYRLSLKETRRDFEATARRHKKSFSRNKIANFLKWLCGDLIKLCRGPSSKERLSRRRAHSEEDVRQNRIDGISINSEK